MGAGGRRQPGRGGEVHQAVVADVGDDVCRAACAELQAVGRRHAATTDAGRTLEEVIGSLADPGAVPGIGNEVDDSSVDGPSENEPLQDRIGLQAGGLEALPLLVSQHPRLHAVVGTPVEIVAKVPAVPDQRRDGNDALMLVVAEGNRHVNDQRCKHPGMVLIAAHEDADSR